MASSKDIVVSGPGGGTNDKLATVLKADELPGRLDEVISLLEREDAPPGVWKVVAVEYYRRGLYDEFQSLLERAVEAATASLLDGNVSKTYKTEEERFGPLSLQQIDVCTTLAAFHIYRARQTDSGLSSSTPNTGITTVNTNNVDPEVALRMSEDLLKKAEVILTTTASADTATNQQSAVPAAGRGAQLAAAARLMLSTSASSPSTAMMSCGRGGAAPQQAAHAETQRRFLNGLTHAQRQTLSPLLCYGYLYLTQYTLTEQEPKRSQALARATNTFRVVLASQPDSVLGKLGLAATSLASKQYLAAMRLYANVLYTCPGGPPELRLALGICHFHLGGYERCQQAFFRVLQLRPGDPDALCGLAAAEAILGVPRIIALNHRDSRLLELKNMLNKMVNYYTEARKSDPRHPLAVLGLANSAFYAEKSLTVDELLQQCGNLTTTGRNVVAEWWFQKGRARHARGDIQGAHSDYLQSLGYDPHHLAARFCLSQTCLLLENLLETEKHLQTLVRWCPKNSDVYKLLAYCSLLLGGSALNEFKKATPMQSEGIDTSSEKHLSEAENHFSVVAKCLDFVLANDKDDKEAILLKIKLDETNFHRGRLWLLSSLKKSYESVLNDDDEDVVVELVNNLAVLCVLSAEESRGLQLFNRCLSKLQSQINSCTHAKEESALKALKLTIRFNRALTFETQGLHKEANAEYKQLNSDYPNYRDAWLRRAWLSMERQDLATAKVHLEQTALHGIQTKSLSYLFAELYKIQGRYEKAIKMIKQVLSLGGSDESYTRLVLGSLYHRLSHALAKKPKNSPLDPSGLTPMTALAQAGRYYREALKADPSNWNAANGIAVMLAEQGVTGPASEALASLLDACKSADRAAQATNDVPLSQMRVGCRFLNMEATAHTNLGLFYLSTAMTDNSTIIPGKNVAKLDSIKVAKALKHYLSALALRPLSKSLHKQIGRLFHDSCRFREGKPFLETACAKWPNDVILRHNLSIILEKAIMSEMSQVQYISDPHKVKKWILECHAVVSMHDINQKQKQRFRGISSQGIVAMRNILMNNHVMLSLDDLRKLGAEEGLEQTLQEWGSAVPLPPEGLEYLPSLDKLKSIIEQVGGKLCVGLQSTLPRVEKEWLKKQVELETLKAKNESLRKQQEDERTLSQQLSRESLTQQQRLAEQLQEEQEEIAKSMPLLRDEMSRGSRGGRSAARQADKDFVVEGDVFDGEVGDDDLLPDEVEPSDDERHNKRKKSHHERKKKRNRDYSNEDDEGEDEESRRKRKKHKKKKRREKRKHRDGSNDKEESRSKSRLHKRRHSSGPEKESLDDSSNPKEDETISQ